MTLALRTGCLAALLLLLAAPAAARDRGQYAATDPVIKQWIDSLTDKRGLGCCSTADGFPAEAVWDIEREHYKVNIKGRWYAVPDQAVVTKPNRIGRAMVWFVESGDGAVLIRCFLPGAGV